MENKEKRKRKISVLTIFLWLALVITMSVVVVSGTNKSNALEDTTVEEVGVTGVKRVKLDLREVIENEKITEQTEIEAFLEGYKEKIKVSNVNNSTSTVNADITYVGSEENSIGIYEINIINEAKYIRIESNEYEILNNNEVLELFCYLGKGYYFEGLSESIGEYNFIARKKDTKIVTIKIDFTDLINIRGITEQSEIEPVLENYASRLTGRIKKEDPAVAYITLKSKYVRSENSTIGVYEVEITNDMKYIQITKPYDGQYIELLNNNTCAMSSNGTSLEAGSGRNEYGYIDLSKTTYVEIQKILENVEEYNIKIEKLEEITINVSGEITQIIILNNTTKVALKNYRITNGQVKFKKSKGSEYDLMFVIFQNSGVDIARGIYEGDNELDKKLFYMPYLKEDYYYYKTIKQGENKLEYNFETSGKFKSNVIWEDDRNVKLQFKLREEWKFNRRANRYGDYLYSEYSIKNDHPNVIFIEKLDENFSVSEEYLKDPKWLIVNEEEIKNKKFEVPEYAKSYLNLDLENNKYIPEYVYASFFEHNFDNFTDIDYGMYIKRNDKIYNIYIKDKNMLYCLVPINKPNNELSVNLEYKGDGENKVFKFNTKSIYFYNYTNVSFNMNSQCYYR